MPLTGRPAEHLRGSRHAILTSSAILWFLTQKRETVACGLATASLTDSRAGRSSREGKITASELPVVISITVFAIGSSLREHSLSALYSALGSP